MEKKYQNLDDVFDETIMTENVFVRKNGKLKMIRRKSKIDPQRIRSNKPLFPISKERQ